MRPATTKELTAGRLPSTISLVAALLVATFLAAGCGHGSGAVKSAAASVSASGRPSAGLSASGRPSAPSATTAPAPVPNPTTAQPPAQATVTPTPTLTTPSAVPPSSAPAAPVSATPAAGTGSGSPVWWLWAALGAIVFAGLIAWIAHASGRHRAAAADWQSQVIDAYAKGAVLQDAMSTVAAPGAAAGPDGDARWSDVQRRADDLEQTLYAMREGAPGERERAGVVDVLTSLQAARSSLVAMRSAAGAGRLPGAASTQAEVVRHRLLDFETSLRTLRAPQDGGR